MPDVGDASCLSLASILHESALRHGDRIALVDGTRRFTYAQLWDASAVRASRLSAEGVKRGDRVGLMALNSTEFVAWYFGILAAGAVVVPIPPVLVADEVTYLLADSGTRLVIAEARFEDLARDASLGPSVPVWTADPVTASESDDGAGGARARPPEPRHPLDAAVLFYTSGTTGRPKGAVLTHLNLLMNALVNTFLSGRTQPDDVVLASLPLFHTFGQSVAMNATFLVGARLVLQSRFEAKAALELMEEHDVTTFLGVPTMFIALLGAAEDRESVPPLRLCHSGGAALPVAVLEAFNERFATEILEGYGLSETSPTAASNQHDFGVRPGSVGHAIWGVRVEIARADLEDRIELVPVGEQGEIVIQGHNVFSGYHENPDASAAAVADGWFRSGDLGTKDDEGFVYVVDRKKDLILRGGFNVYPRELEEVLARHPEIDQVAVVGVPHRTHGEEVLAVVVPQANAKLDEEDVIEWAKARIARHKRPRLVAFVDELPLGPSRKVLKRALRERFAALGA